MWYTKWGLRTEKIDVFWGGKSKNSRTINHHKPRYLANLATMFFPIPKSGKICFPSSVYRRCASAGHLLGLCTSWVEGWIKTCFFYRRKTQRHVNYQGAKKGWTALIHSYLWTDGVGQRIAEICLLWNQNFNCHGEEAPNNQYGDTCFVVGQCCVRTIELLSAWNVGWFGEVSPTTIPVIYWWPLQIQPLLPSKYGNPWKSQQSFQESLKAISRI